MASVYLIRHLKPWSRTCQASLSSSKGRLLLMQNDSEDLPYQGDRRVMASGALQNNA